MADDPYETLGVKKDASQEDIQKAYRRHAKTSASTFEGMTSATDTAAASNGMFGRVIGRSLTLLDGRPP